MLHKCFLEQLRCLTKKGGGKYRAVQEAAWTKMRELKDEHRAKLDEYYAREREYREFRNQDRARKCGPLQSTMISLSLYHTV